MGYHNRSSLPHLMKFPYFNGAMRGGLSSDETPIFILHSLQLCVCEGLNRRRLGTIIRFEDDCDS